MDVSNQRYIDLLKFVLTDYHRMDMGEYKPVDVTSWRTGLLGSLSRLLEKKGYTVCRKLFPTKEERMNGLDWPAYAETMIGVKRLENLETLIKDVVSNNVKGDLIETGVWRGGATIFMKAMLNALGDTERLVWVADSFQGLPKPDAERYAADKNDEHYKIAELAISKDTVEANFRKYNLLDDRIKFLKGWFKDTLPTAPFTNFAIVRLDGDMYESTMDGLVNLYPRLSTGGYLIIDDYEAVKGCKSAVNDYRSQNSIKDPIQQIDYSAVFWRKSG